MTTLDQAPTELAGTKSRLALRLRVEHALTAGTVVSLLALWTLLSHYGLVNPLFLPPPEAVWSSFVEVLTKGYQGQQLHQHMEASLARILAGYFTACVVGIPLGLLMGFTYTVLVASEIVAATAGIGWMIWDASKFLLSDVVIMGLFVLGLTGLALDWAIRQFERFVTPWRFA